MDFKKYIDKKIIATFMPGGRVEGKVTGIVDGGCDEPWLSIELSTDDKRLDGKTALVDCGMITCIVEME